MPPTYVARIIAGILFAIAVVLSVIDIRSREPARFDKWRDLLTGIAAIVLLVAGIG